MLLAAEAITPLENEQLDIEEDGQHMELAKEEQARRVRRRRDIL